MNLQSNDQTLWMALGGTIVTEAVHPLVLEQDSRSWQTSKFYDAPGWNSPVAFVGRTLGLSLAREFAGDKARKYTE
jgi:hypothetical protein